MKRRNAIKAAIAGVAAACGLKAKKKESLLPLYWNVTYEWTVKPDGSWETLRRKATPVYSDYHRGVEGMETS